MRWDYNTIAELQDLGYDLMDEKFQKVFGASKRLPLKMLLAFACAALISGSENGEMWTPKQIGRIVTEEGESTELFAKVTELLQIANGDPGPLAVAIPAESA